MRLVVAVCLLAGCGHAFAQILTNPEYFATEKDALEAVEAANATISAAADVAALGYTKAGGSEDLAFAMKRGWWQLAETLIHTYKAAKVDLTAALYQSASFIKSRIQKLQDSLQKQKFTQGIGPAFRWAQSPDTVFIEQKFSHKWDTPATLGCKREKLSISGHDISFHAMCRKHRKRFTLDLQLFKPIDKKLSTVTFNSVGRATITLRKMSNSSWPRLLKAKGSKPSNMHTWWSMKQKHEADLSTFEAEERNRTREAKLAAKAAEAAAQAANPSGDAAKPAPAADAAETQAQASEADATASTDGEASTVEVDASGTATATGSDGAEQSAPAAALDAEQLEAQAAAKAKAEQRERLTRALGMMEREELGKVDSQARADKKAIDVEARSKKQAIDERIAKEKEAILAKFAAKRQKLET